MYADPGLCATEHNHRSRSLVLDFDSPAAGPSPLPLAVVYVSRRFAIVFPIKSERLALAAAITSQ
jgi:hypothetical protein